jgi:hypothetical protein
MMADDFFDGLANATDVYWAIRWLRHGGERQALHLDCVQGRGVRAPAVVVCSFNSQMPGTQVIAEALFQVDAGAEVCS